MMLRKLTLLVLVCIFLKPEIQAQRHQYSAVKIGEKVPEFVLSNLINYPFDSVRISDFKGKLLVLDFWNSGCASCIESWPKLLSLQKEFKDSLQIVLVNTSQRASTVRSLIELREAKLGYKMTLPMVCGDTTIQHLFPHTSVPHVVWIDRDGFVLSVTRNDALHSKNIRTILNGKVPRMALKSGAEHAYSFKEPIFINGNGGPGDQVLWQSVLSKYYPGFFGTTFISGGISLLSNICIKDMFRFLLGGPTNRFGNQNYVPSSRTDLVVRDQSKYNLRDKNGELQYDNLYTYQLFTKLDVPTLKLRGMIIDDIKRYLGLEYYWEERTKDCLVLSCKDTSRIQYMEGELKYWISDVKMELNKVSMQEVVEFLSSDIYPEIPVVDETNSHGMIGGINLEANIKNYEDLNKALVKYGLSLTLAKRKINVLIVREVGL